MIQPPMKTLLRSFCAVFAFGLLVNGCASDPSASNRRAAVSHGQRDPIEIPPHDGMTRGEVLAQYGQPRAINVSDRGEVWTYLLNGGEIVGKSFIPFYPPVRPRFGTVIFGPDERVREYHWQPDPRA